jgi:hypothetical protein
VRDDKIYAYLTIEAVEVDDVELRVLLGQEEDDVGGAAMHAQYKMHKHGL